VIKFTPPPHIDHHCPWISNCVGKRNRKLFIQLLIFTSLLSFEILALSVYKFILCLNRNDYSEPRLISLVIFIALSSCFGFSVFLLLALQILLVLKGLTTNEYLRGTFNNIENPFDNGCCRNFWAFFINETGPRNISLNYLIDKQKYDDNMTLNSKVESKRHSDFSLEMNMMKTIEMLKLEADDEKGNGNGMHIKLINDPNAI